MLSSHRFLCLPLRLPPKQLHVSYELLYVSCEQLYVGCETAVYGL